MIRVNTDSPNLRRNEESQSGRLAANVLQKEVDALDAAGKKRCSQVRRIGTPKSNSELGIREKSFDATHRNSVFQLGTPYSEKKLRYVPSYRDSASPTVNR